MLSANEPVAVAARLTAALRREGLAGGVDRTQAFVQAASLCGDLYWAGRVALVSRPEDIPLYDRVFYGLFAESPAMVKNQPVCEGDAEGAGEVEGECPEAQQLEASRIELLRNTPFDRLTDDDLAELARALEQVRRASITRPTRRWRPARQHGRVDLRRTLREMHRLDAAAVLPHHSLPATRPQPLTFVLDVSGSMRGHMRGLLLACTSFVRAEPIHEAFTFGTRLTRVSAPLRGGSFEAGLERACALAGDRDGGTRIADSLDQLLTHHGQTRVIRGAIVVICSDGLETGDPAELGRVMERLALHARRLVWLNPLSGSPTYEPLARGMAAALPHVDTFGSGHNLASLESVVSAVLDEVRRCS